MRKKPTFYKLFSVLGVNDDDMFEVSEVMTRIKPSTTA